MNRNDEFIELKQSIEQTPGELEFVTAKTIAKVKKQKRISMLIETPLISFGMLVITFVLLVNLFPSVALAMSNVPVLKDLVSAVAIDPSLKAAVENDYYQAIGLSQTREDVTVTVDYMILDAGHISFFFHVNAPVKAGLYNFQFFDSTGNPLTAVLMYDTMYENNKMEEIKIDFVDGNYQLPRELTFQVTVNQDQHFQEFQEAVMPASTESTSSTEATAPNSEGIDYVFTFLLYPDKNFSQTVDNYPIHQWVEMNGQNIYLESMDIYPTQARLYFDCGDDNSSVIHGLDIYFEDKNGNIYSGKSGLSATGSIDSQDIGSLYFESSYFADADNFILYIEGISCIDIDRVYGKIDYATKTITNLPEGVTVDSMELSDSTLRFTLKAKLNEPNYQPHLISSEYLDIDGNKYYFRSWYYGYRGEDKTTFYANYEIADFEDNKYKINWIYAPIQPLKAPISIKINKAP